MMMAAAAAAMMKWRYTYRRRIDGETEIEEGIEVPREERREMR